MKLTPRIAIILFASLCVVAVLLGAYALAG